MQFASFPLESKENFCFVIRLETIFWVLLRIFADFSAQDRTAFSVSRFRSK